MANATLILSLLLVLFASLVFYKLSSASRSKLPLPPGPQPKFFSGNVHQLPRKSPWKVFAEWSTLYNSPIIFYRIFGRKVVVINTVEAAMALLEGRSGIYSDRPIAWLYKELMARKMAVFNISSQHPRFKIYRKILHSGLNARAVQRYASLQERENLTLLRGLLNSPVQFISHLRRNAGAVILEIAYGRHVQEENDYFVSLMEEMFKLHTEIMRPGRFLVDVLPFLRFVPSWFPGAYFKRYAMECRERMSQIDLAPHAWAKDQIASATGVFNPSFTSQHLIPEDDHMVDSEEDDIIKWCSSALYVGATDTTISFMETFLVLMMQYPDIQSKAQAEIDHVAGLDRLPTLDDQDRMVYISALIKEVLRYAPPAPMGLPHRAIESDDYAGYSIPQGSTVIGNIWALTRDSSVYLDPEIFNPDRFLPGTEQMDPRKLVFGFGRRICPGAHFAESSIFLNLTSILATFTVRKPLDESGKEADPIITYTSSAVTSHPEPFECRFVVRAKPHVLDLINS